MRRPVAAWSVVTLLAAGACGGDAPGASARADASGVVRSEPLRLTGAFEGESRLLTPCSDPGVTLDVAAAPAVRDLSALHAELVPALAPGEAIFVDVRGVVVQQGEEMSFELREVYRAGWEDWGCDWTPSVQPLRFAAAGSEPDWSIHVGADSTAVYSDLEGSSTGSVQTLAGSLAAGWTASGAIGGEGWTLELFEAPCRNPMSGGWSHLVATLTLGERTRSGCGFIGDATDVL